MPIVPVFPSTPPAASGLPLSFVAPATIALTAGTTTTPITWNAASGGTTPYTYTAAAIVYDSTGASTTSTLSDASDLASTLAGQVNGQVVVIQKSVTDATGLTIAVRVTVATAAGAATLTFASTPANQSLAATATASTLGTWGAASGGTGPYTYAVTEISAAGLVVSGSGLGDWAASGYSPGASYAFLMTATDALLAKGYSVITVQVEAVENLGLWEVLGECEFDDADWTAFSSTDATGSTSAWQHTLYGADGVTPRAYIYNVGTAARTLSLVPSGSGLTLVNGTAAVQPSVGVWPANWTPLIGGSRADAWMIEAVISGEEPAGATSFVHMQAIGSGTMGNNALAPATGHRTTESGTNIIQRAYSYISGFAFENIRTTAFVAVPRVYTAAVQVTIADSRRHDIFITTPSTDFRPPETGSRVRSQSPSTTMTAVGAESTTDGGNWFGSTIQTRTKWWLYHDGSATSGSAIRVRKLRLLRMVGGSR